MPAELLGIGTFVLFIIAIGTFLMWGDNVVHVSVPAAFTTTVLLLFLWIFVSVSQTPRTLKSELHQVHNIEGVQYVQWVDRDNRICISNLNKYFDRTVPEDAKIRVTVYEAGPYIGVYYGELRDKLEIEPPNSCGRP